MIRNVSESTKKRNTVRDNFIPTPEERKMGFTTRGMYRIYRNLNEVIDRHLAEFEAGC